MSLERISRLVLPLLSNKSLASLMLLQGVHGFVGVKVIRFLQQMFLGN